jgi:hypothetical protein
MRCKGTAVVIKITGGKLNTVISKSFAINITYIR